MPFFSKNKLLKKEQTQQLSRIDKYVHVYIYIFISYSNEFETRENK